MAHRDRISALLADVIPSVSDAEISGVLAAFDAQTSDLSTEAPTLVKHPVCDELKQIRAREAAKATATPRPIVAPEMTTAKAGDSVRPVTMDSIPDMAEVEEVTVAVQSSPELAAAPPAPVAEPKAPSVAKIAKAEKSATRAREVSAATPGAMVTSKPVDTAKATPTAAEIRSHMEKVRAERLGPGEVKRTKRSASWGLVAIAAALVVGVGTTGPGRTLAQQGKAWAASLPLTTAMAHATPASAPPAAAAPVVTTTTDEPAPAAAPKAETAPVAPVAQASAEPPKVEAAPPVKSTRSKKR